MKDTDIVKRLRMAAVVFGPGRNSLETDAADEIERLTTENESLKLTLIELSANKNLRLADDAFRGRHSTND
jgi:hypothetical protein